MSRRLLEWRRHGQWTKGERRLWLEFLPNDVRGFYALQLPPRLCLLLEAAYTSASAATVCCLRQYSTQEFIEQFQDPAVVSGPYGIMVATRLPYLPAGVDEYNPEVRSRFRARRAGGWEGGGFVCSAATLAVA